MKFKSSLLSLGILLGVASSCQKEDIKVQQPSGQGQAQGQAASNRGFYRSSCSPENTENPLDSVGVYHNKALDYSDEQNPTPTFSEALKLSNSYTIQTFERRIPNVRELVPTEEQMHVLLSDTASWFTNTIRGLDYSDACKERLIQLNSLVRETAFAHPGDYCAVKEAVLAFEQDVMRSDALRDTEKAEVLKAASVARYSAYRWIERYNAQEGRAFPTSTGQRKWWGWVIVIVADIAGGYYGGVGGASGARGTAGTLFP